MSIANSGSVGRGKPMENKRERIATQIASRAVEAMDGMYDARIDEYSDEGLEIFQRIRDQILEEEEDE